MIAKSVASYSLAKLKSYAVSAVIFFFELFRLKISGTVTGVVSIIFYVKSFRLESYGRRNQ